MSAIKRIIILSLAMTSTAATWQCDIFQTERGTFGLCPALDLVIAPDSCVAIANPCTGGGWRALQDHTIENMTLRRSPDSISLLTAGSVEGETNRYVCAAADAPIGRYPDFGYLYRSSQGDRNTGEMRLVVEPPLVVTVSAEPDRIHAGEHSQLIAHVSGGIPFDLNPPLYRYDWDGEQLDFHAGASAIATPESTATYHLKVTDAVGVTSRAEVTVHVDSILSASFTFLRGASNPPAQTTRWTFDASASTGSITSYSWHVTRTNGVAVLDTTTAGPILEVELPEDVVKGNMTLTVTAADKTTASSTQAFR